MTGLAWIGVDPGARWSGIVARQGTRLLGWRVIDVHDLEPGADRPGELTLAAIEATISELGALAGGTFRVAVEDTVPPNSHHEGRVSIVQVEPLLRAAEVVGHVRRAFPGTVLVRPHGHGSSALASYLAACPELVTPREHANAVRKGTLLARAPQNTTLRHARSAWDVAHSGSVQARIDAATATQARRPVRQA